MDDQPVNTIAFDRKFDPESDLLSVATSPPEKPDKRFEDGPWAQKFMLGSDKKLAVEAAERSKRRIGDWLGEAIREKVALEREDRGIDVLPPGGRTVAPARSDLSIDDIGRLLAVAEHIARLQNRPLAANSRILTGARRRLTALLTG